MNRFAVCLLIAAPAAAHAAEPGYGYAPPPPYGLQVPACGSAPSPDPCLSYLPNGVYFTSRERGYSVRCGPFDCRAMVREFIDNGRAPENPIAPLFKNEGE
jgi:hypothetical protein